MFTTFLSILKSWIFVYTVLSKKCFFFCLLNTMRMFLLRCPHALIQFYTKTKNCSRLYKIILYSLYVYNSNTSMRILVYKRKPHSLILQNNKKKNNTKNTHIYRGKLENSNTIEIDIRFQTFQFHIIVIGLDCFLIIN